MTQADLLWPAIAVIAMCVLFAATIVGCTIVELRKARGGEG